MHDRGGSYAKLSRAFSGFAVLLLLPGIVLSQETVKVRLEAGEPFDCLSERTMDERIVPPPPMRLVSDNLLVIRMEQTSQSLYFLNELTRSCQLTRARGVRSEYQPDFFSPPRTGGIGPYCRGAWVGPSFWAGALGGSRLASQYWRDNCELGVFSVISSELGEILMNGKIAPDQEIEIVRRPAIELISPADQVAEDEHPD